MDGEVALGGEIDAGVLDGGEAHELILAAVDEVFPAGLEEEAVAIVLDHACPAESEGNIERCSGEIEFIFVDIEKDLLRG